MKRLILPLFLTALAVPTLAQEDSFRLGIKLAPNIAWMRSDSRDLVSDGNKLGFSFGLLGDLAIGERGNYFFSTGVVLTNIGGQFKADDTYDIAGVSTKVQSEQDLKLRYVEIPMTLKLRTVEDKPMNFYAQVGTSLAFNVRARTDFSSTTTPVGGTATTVTLDNENVIDNTALFKMAFVVGGGVEYDLGSGTTLFGGITYNNAFTNTLDGDARNLLPNDNRSKLFADYLEFTLGVFL